MAGIEPASERFNEENLYGRTQFAPRVFVRLMSELLPDVTSPKLDGITPVIDLTSFSRPMPA